MDIKFGNKKENIINNDIESLPDDFPITVKDSSNILAEINFKTTDDMLLMKSIVNSMEKEIADSVSKDLCVSIPYIGRIRRNNYKQYFLSRKEEHKTAKKHLSREDYAAYIKEFKNDYYENKKAEDELQLKIKRLKSIFKDKYKLYSTKINKAYADLFIHSLMWFEVVPFDQEVQDQFDRLNKES